MAPTGQAQQDWKKDLASPGIHGRGWRKEGEERGGGLAQFPPPTELGPPGGRAEGRPGGGGSWIHKQTRLGHEVPRRMGWGLPACRAQPGAGRPV